MRARRSGALLVSTGLLCLGGAALPLVTSAHADADPGSGLGSFALSANAPVLQARYDDPAHQCATATAGPAGCEGVVNETVAQLSNGPVGYALSSVTWPGTLAGNLGSLLITAGGSNVPPEASALNSPIRAEAHTGGKPVVTDYPPAPAPVLAHMRADAQATKVTADAALGGVQQPTIGSLGASTSRSVTELTGASAARATAHSEVQNLVIAGVLTIGAVVSDAEATTDGTTAKASGHTVISGASVAGIPVSIDENGITADTQNVPIPSAAVDAVNSAIAGAGITVALSKPHGTPVGAGVAYDAGVLAIVWDIQPGMGASIEIGGAQVSVTSSPGYVPPSFSGSTTGGSTGGGSSTGGAIAPPPLTGGTDVPSLPGGITPPTVTGPQAFVPEPSGFRGALPHGLSPWLGGLVVVGSFLTMAGLRRLPDRVLVASSSSCPNGDQQ
jgi:hypothetical protein